MCVINKSQSRKIIFHSTIPRILSGFLLQRNLRKSRMLIILFSLSGKSLTDLYGGLGGEKFINGTLDYKRNSYPTQFSMLNIKMNKSNSYLI